MHPVSARRVESSVADQVVSEGAPVAISWRRRDAGEATAHPGDRAWMATRMKPPSCSWGCTVRNRRRPGGRELPLSAKFPLGAWSGNFAASRVISLAAIPR